MNRCGRRFFCIFLLVCLLLPGAALGYEVYLPHVTGTGGVWGTYLQVDNNHPLPLSYTLALYDAGEQVFEERFTVEGFSESVVDLKSLAPTLAAGSGVITYTSELLNFRLSYENKSGGGVAEFRLTGERHAILGFYFSDFSTAITWKAIALTNLNSTAAAVKLYAIGMGNLLGSADLTLQPYSKTVGYYTTWFPGVDFSAIKKIIAVSAVELSGVTISGNTDSSLLLFTAASAVSNFNTGISDSDNYTGTWRGTWQSFDDPPSSGDLVFRINHTGVSFTGTADVTGTDCGDVEGVPINGTVSGNTLAINGTHQCYEFISTLAFTSAKVTDGVMNGSYTQYIDGDYYDSGSFTAAKE